MRTDTSPTTSSLEQAPGPRLPTFLLIGAMKAGTTSLYHYLKAHPQVATPQYKAPEFFIEEATWHRGIDWYAKQFPPPAPGVVAVGEASNAYTKFPRYQGVPERIASQLPSVRLLYSVRDPIARIRSHYQTRVTEGSEKAPLEEAVFTNPIYLDYSRYALQVDQYLDHFAREQLLLIPAENLRGSRDETMRRVYEFIGVDADFVPADLGRDFYQTADRASRSPIPLKLRKELKRRFPATRRFKELENNVVGAVRRATSRQDRPGPPSERFVVSEVVRQRLADALHDDVSRLRRHMEPNFDGWGIG